MTSKLHSATGGASNDAGGPMTLWCFSRAHGTSADMGCAIDELGLGSGHLCDPQPLLLCSLALAAMLCGCNPKILAPVEIHPCITSISNADFSSPLLFSEFLRKAVPLGSNKHCSERVMVGRKMYKNSYQDNNGKLEHIHFTETRFNRLKALLMLGYDTRSVHFEYTDDKLTRMAVN